MTTDWQRADELAREREAKLAREEEERLVLERVEYEAGERPFLMDPQALLCFVGGPLEGQMRGPTICECERCERHGGHGDCWPLRWNPEYGYAEPAEGGEYLLAYVWAPRGVTSGAVFQDEAGTIWEPGFEREPETDLE